MWFNKTRRGTQHHNSSLTEKDIPEIRKMIAAEVPIKEIAKKYEVSLQSIYKIRNRESWRHV